MKITIKGKGDLTWQQLLGSRRSGNPYQPYKRYTIIRYRLPLLVPKQRPGRKPDV